MTRALVIGASGFIGLHVVDRLLAQGIEVRATVRKSTPTMFLRKRRIELVPGALEDPASLRAAMEGCDAVFLSGAHYPRYSVNLEQSLQYGVTGVRNACDAARDAGVARLVYTGSIATLDPHAGGDGLSTEDDGARTMPANSVYRAVKWAMEREVQAAMQRGLPAVTLLVGGCVGAGDFRVGTSGVLLLTVRGELPFWVDGTVNLIDVEDAAQAHVAALCAPGTRYNVAPHNVRFGALVEQIAGRYGGQLPAEVSTEQAVELADATEHTAMLRKERVPFPRELVDLIITGHPVSCERAQRELGLEFSPLLPALDRTHEFFTRYGFLPRKSRRERESA